MKTYYIYSLINPLNDSAYYVGCTTNPKRRLNAHRYDNKESHCEEKKAIEQNIRDAGKLPEMQILDQMDADTSEWPLIIEKLWTVKLNQEGQQVIGGNLDSLYARYETGNIDERIARCKFRMNNPNAPVNIGLSLDYSEETEPADQRVFNSTGGMNA